MINRYFIAMERKNARMERRIRRRRMKLSTRIVLFIHEHIKPLKARTLERFDIFYIL